MNEILELKVDNVEKGYIMEVGLLWNIQMVGCNIK
jgi:hypothetical protein